MEKRGENGAYTVIMLSCVCVCVCACVCVCVHCDYVVAVVVSRHARGHDAVETGGGVEEEAGGGDFEAGGVWGMGDECVCDGGCVVCDV